MQGRLSADLSKMCSILSIIDSIDVRPTDLHSSVRRPLQLVHRRPPTRNYSHSRSAARQGTTPTRALPPDEEQIHHRPTRNNSLTGTHAHTTNTPCEFARVAELTTTRANSSHDVFTDEFT